HTYPLVIAELLEQMLPDMEVIVANAGISGFSSWQVRRMLEIEAPLFDPDVVTVYIGTNDLAIGPYTDQDYPEVPAALEVVRGAAAHSRFLMLIRTGILKLLEVSVNARQSPARVIERVPEGQYRDNLQAILD